MRFVAVQSGLPTMVSLSSPLFPQLLLDDQLVQQQLQVAAQMPLQFACVPGSFGQVHPSALCPMPVPQGSQCLQAPGSPWQAASNNDIGKEKSRKKKRLGPEMSNVYVVTLPDSKSIKGFMEKMPDFSYPVVIERFVYVRLALPPLSFSTHTEPSTQREGDSLFPGRSVAARCKAFECEEDYWFSSGGPSVLRSDPHHQEQAGDDLGRGNDPGWAMWFTGDGHRRTCCCAASQRESQQVVLPHVHPIFERKRSDAPSAYH